MKKVGKKVLDKSKSSNLNNTPSFKPTKIDMKANKKKIKNDAQLEEVVAVKEDQQKEKKIRKNKKQQSSMGDAKQSSVAPEQNPFAKLPVVQTDYVPGALSAVLGLTSAGNSINEALEIRPKSSGVKTSEVDAGEETMNIDQPWLTESSTIQRKEPKTKKKKVSTESEKREESERNDYDLSRIQQRQNRRKKEEKMTEEESIRTIFVGNVNKETSEKLVKNLFKQFGAIDSIRMRGVIPNSAKITKKVAKISQQTHDKQQCVHFYIKYKETESVEKALELNGTTHWDHRIRVDKCSSKKEYDNKHTIFLGNVPFDANEDTLADHFEKHVGNVSFARIVRDAATGIGKGFAFIVFKDSASVTLALNLIGVKYKKRELRISKILKKNKLKKTFNKENIAKKSLTGKGKGVRERQSSGKTTVRNANTESERINRKSVKRAIAKRKAMKKGKSIMTN